VNSHLKYFIFNNQSRQPNTTLTTCSADLLVVMAVATIFSIMDWQFTTWFIVFGLVALNVCIRHDFRKWTCLEGRCLYL